jgi:choline-phosphate cytidylyltransferase
MSDGIVITFGTFDVLRVGHLRLLERARSYGSELVVGVSTDELNLSKKGRLPVYKQAERSETISALRSVDKVFLEDSLEIKANIFVATRLTCWSWETTGKSNLTNSAIFAK